MAKSKEELFIVVLRTILFVAGLFCIVYYIRLEKKAEKEYASITYHRIDTAYTDACNFKYEITYDTLYSLNRTRISKDTVRILEEAESAKTELESKKPLTASERARLKAKADMGDSIWAYFDRKGLFFNHMALAAIASGKNNKIFEKYAKEPMYNTKIKEVLEEKDRRIIHKVKGDVTPDGSTKNNVFLDADYYDNQHLLLIDYSFLDKGTFYTVLDDQGNVIIPASDKYLNIIMDCIVKQDWNSNDVETFDFKGNHIEGNNTWYITKDNILIFGFALIVLAIVSFVLEFFINISQYRKDK